MGLDRLGRGDHECTSQPGRSRKSTLFGAQLFPPAVRRDPAYTTSMDRSQGEPIRERPWKDTILNISGKMERARSLDRARHHSYGACCGACACAMERPRRRETGKKGRPIYGPDWERAEEERKVCIVLEQVAKEVGTESITAGALYIPDESGSGAEQPC